MEWLTLVFGTLWVAQVHTASGEGFSSAAPSPRRSPAAETANHASWERGRAANPDRESQADVTGKAARLPTGRATAAELANVSFRFPPDGPLGGRPTTLLEVLGTTSNRAEQTAIAHAFWRLAAGVGEYHARWVAMQRLGQLPPRAEDASQLRSRRALATEALLRAETKVAEAQRALAVAARWSVGVPLPADLPHAGPYRTGLSEGLAAQAVPPRNRLVHRELPLRREGLDLRAAAVQAAEDALEAAIDAYRDGSVEIGSVLSCLANATAQREAFVHEVRAYNEVIADFALSVAAVDTSPSALVSMLILPTSQAESSARSVENLASPRILPGKRAEAAPASGVERASWVFPTPPVGSGIPPAQTGQPTLAPPKPKLLSEDGPEAEAFPSRPKAPSAPFAERGARLKGDPGDNLDSDPGAGQSMPLPPKPIPEHTVRRVPVADRSADAPNNLGALYPSLISSSTTARVQQLAAALHGNNQAMSDAVQAVELHECLRGVSASDRQGLLDAYWTASQRAAAYRVIANQGELIDQIAPLALAHRQRPSGPLDMLQLRAARLASEADRLAASVELVRAQFELTQRASRSLAGSWLTPATAPHAGPYRLKLDEQRPEVVQQPVLKRLARTVPSLFDALQQQAASVVEADTARAAAIAAYEMSGRSIDQTLTSLRWQTAETLVFLQTLAGYNRAIAQYALAVLPAAIPGEQLVPALVLTSQ